MAKKGLGKGLGTFFENTDIPDFSEPNESKDGASELRISLIEPNRNQPRQSFDSEKLDALAQSIYEHGLLQPIAVTPRKNGRYMIIAGERRWRAARKAGLESVPVIIKKCSEEEIAQLALIENLQREDLNPIEEALGYRRLIDEFSLTQEEVSRKIGKSRSAVANSLRLLTLGEKLQKLLKDGLLTGGHARALLSVDNDEDRQRLAQMIIDNGLNVRKAEELAKNLPKQREKQPEKQKEETAGEIELERISGRLSSVLGTKVKISQTKKRGRIEIEYFGNDDLDRILSFFDME